MGAHFGGPLFWLRMGERASPPRLSLAAAGGAVYASRSQIRQSRRRAMAFYRTGQEHMAAEHFDFATQAFTSAIDRTRCSPSRIIQLQTGV